VDAHVPQCPQLGRLITSGERANKKGAVETAPFFVMW
jgi:hypothetical protein